ncbi:MAG: phosphatidylserine decarboxylase family protein [Ignavibacteriaceae bacterium]
MGIIFIVVFVLIAISILLDNNFIRVPLLLISAFLVIFTLNFFRDPERRVPNKSNVVVSPADGRILFVKDVLDDKFLNSKAKLVSIFMSPLNVHVNRIPVTGKVEYVKYIQGEYIAAFEDKASERNERNEIGITSPAGKVFFIQIAGFVARRIVNDLKVGDSVNIGNRFGMIKFGSRVDIIVPEQWQVKVKKDDNVTAGETILFEY